MQYRASLGQKNTTRLDITRDETVCFEVKEESYRFEDIPRFTLPVYSLEEIFVEKIRSLFERNRARDFFDVYKILERNDTVDFRRISNGLKRKMKIKGMDLDLKLSAEKVRNVESHWDSALDRLISTAEKPEFSRAIEEIEKLLSCIRGLDEDFI